MSVSRQQPIKGYNFQPAVENIPLGVGGNFHDDPICRSTLRKSHTLGLDAKLPEAYSPHTQYQFSGVQNDFTWLYQSSSAAYGATASARREVATPPQQADQPVLRFLAYTREAISESSAEGTRIRKMGIVFHMVDNSIAIREARQPNSGIVQGQVLLRQRVPRRLENPDDVLTIDDFKIGAPVVIFGKEYHIVDMDESSRRYFRETLKRDIPDFAVPWPEDEDTYNAKVANSLHFRARKFIPTQIMDQKRVVEQLNSGIISKHPPDEIQTAQQFLRNKINEHLQFAALWDDRSKISGDLRHCVIRYYLENDTIEIMEDRPDNCGREGSCKLLCRQRVTRDGSEVPVHAGLQNTFGVILKNNYLQAPDIKIGQFLKVYHRDYLVYDADSFTRKYVKETYGVDLAPAVDVSEIVARGKIELPLQFPPPHDGYGTEEDSLQNWKHLMLKAPKGDAAKMEREDGRVMVFSAVLAPPVAPEDEGRQFVICFHRATDEVEIIENQVRNSGIVPGKFLAKRRHLKALPGGRNVPFTPADFEVGKPVTIYSRTFILTAIDKRSYRIVHSIPDTVTEDRIRELVIIFKNLLQIRYLRIHEAYRQIAPQGALTIKEITEFFRNCSCLLTEEEAIHLVQYMSPLGNGVVSYDEFIQVMDIPNSDNMDVTSINPRSVKNITLTVDKQFASATTVAAETSLVRNLTQQLIAKLDQRRGTVQEVFRLLSNHNTNGKLNKKDFRIALKELLHFNVTPKEENILVSVLFNGMEDASGDITFRQFHEFLEAH